MTRQALSRNSVYSRAEALTPQSGSRVPYPALNHSIWLFLLLLHTYPLFLSSISK
jgi:hypothetical protein